MPWLMALRVVSLPATTRRMKNEPNSCAREPLAVDLGVHQHRRDVVASGWPGGPRRAPGRRRTSPARPASGRRSVPPYSGSPAPRMTLVQWKTCSVSSSGMPIISQMISQRQRSGDLLDEVARAGRGGPRACGRRRSAALSLTYSSTRATSFGREALGDERAQAVVLRVVHVDHRAEELVELLTGRSPMFEPWPEQNSCGLRLAAQTSSWRTSAQ